MANYNLTNQSISSSFQQLLQKNETTGYLVDGTGSIVDGLNITGSITASSFKGDGSGLTGITSTVPPGTVSGSSQVSDLTGSLIRTASNDFSEITFTKGDGSTFLIDGTPRKVIETVINKNGFMAKGTPVYVSGSTGNALHVYAASASRADRMPATFVLNQDLNPDEEGYGILNGFINGVNTSTFGEGDNVYVGANGGYTNTKPTGSGILIQKLGNVVKSAINGSGVISGAGRSNDLPNIQQGYLWVGNSDGVPTTVASSSITPTPEGVATTGSNVFVGNQTVSGSVTIQDTNIPMSGLTLLNGSGGGAIQIIPEGDFTSSFNEATLTGITNIVANAISESTHYIGYQNNDIRIKNLDTAAGIASIDLGFGTAEGDYALKLSSGSNNANFKGNVDVTGNLTVSGSTNVVGDVTASNFSGTYNGTWNGDLDIDGTITVINGGINTSTNTSVSFGRELFVTQSQQSSQGTIVLSYPYTSSFGSTGQMSQRFITNAPVTTFEQNLTGVNFSYFKQTGGGAMIFETLGGSTDINLFSSQRIGLNADSQINADKLIKQTIPALGNNTEKDSIVLTNVTGSNGTNYAWSHVCMQNYPGTNEQAFVVEYSDSSFQKYNALMVSVDRSKFEINTGAGYDFDKVELRDNNDNTSTFQVKADNLDLGKSTATLIEIGNDGGTNVISGSTAFNGNSTQSGHLKQTFNEPGNNNQIDNLKVNSWTDKYGYNITNSTLGWQHYNGTVVGWTQELYTSDYAYGSVVFHEPSKINWGMFASGSAYNGGSLTLQDNGDTTVSLIANTDIIELTGSLGVLGNQTNTGWAIQTFDDVSNNNQINQFKVNNWTAPSGHTIANSTIGWQRYDGTVHGWVQELYTGDYSYGSSVQHEPGKWEAQLFASGSAYSGGGIRLLDNGDTSVDIRLDADTTTITNVMKLTELDPLPAGGVGQLAVSGSNLYFHNGTSWSQIN